MADESGRASAWPGSGGRAETPDERYDRNWGELLQELRVLQTGTQILTGFLLAIAFQSGFPELSEGQRAMYLVLVVLSGMSAVLALAPVSLHRFLFRHHAKAQLVEFGAIGAIAGGIAAVAAAGIGTLFAQRVLDLPPTWSGTTLATGALVGTAAAMLAGWLSMRRHLHATVRETLGAAG